MPLEFKGTFNKSQFERLASFARGQLQYIDARLSHLVAEQQRVGTLLFSFDSTGVPTAYVPPDPNTYVGKLVQAYETLGGDVFYDLQVRTKANPVFLTKGDETSTPKILSNGEPLPQPGLADAPTAALVGQIRFFMEDVLVKRANLERKIRRSIDYVDQLQDEIDELNQVRLSIETEGSLESNINEVEQLLVDPGYLATLDDGGKDTFGKLVRAPMASYEPGGVRQPPDGVGVERSSAGYVVSGEDNGADG
jgi:hypothetical protein